MLDSSRVSLSPSVVPKAHTSQGVMATGPEVDSESPSFQVAVKTMFGERVNMTVSNTDSISSLKQKITRKLNVPEDGFTLLHNTRLVCCVISNKCCGVIVLS